VQGAGVPRHDPRISRIPLWFASVEYGLSVGKGFVVVGAGYSRGAKQREPYHGNQQDAIEEMSNPVPNQVTTTPNGSDLPKSTKSSLLTSSLRSIPARTGEPEKHRKILTRLKVYPRPYGRTDRRD
jgi:hypothetical protein